MPVNQYVLEASDLDGSTVIFPRDFDHVDEDAYEPPKPDQRKNFLPKVVNSLEDGTGTGIDVTVTVHGSTSDDDSFIQHSQLEQIGNVNQPVTVSSGAFPTGDETSNDNIGVLTTSNPYTYYGLKLEFSGTPESGKLKAVFNSKY